jgi:NAD(P)-dependent dehydrogenase (short-subunit alcohol dehydrogenase family)
MFEDGTATSGTAAGYRTGDAGRRQFLTRVREEGGSVPVAFSGRCVIVTGAGNGLGREYALEFARRGACVVVNDPGVAVDGSGGDEAVADRVVAEIIQAGGKAVASYESVASPDGGAAIVETSVASFGRVDAVVNNAGNRRPNAFPDIKPEDLQSVVATHLMGSFYVSQAAYRVMQHNGYGRFVFISSNAGLLGNRNLANYAAAKAGMLGLANVIALEGADHGILANTVLPMAATPRAFQGHGRHTQGAPTGGRPADRHAGNGLRGGRPEDMAPLVVALASEACTFTHRVYSYGYGRLALAFIGMTNGWYPDDPSSVTAEDVLANLVTADDRTHYVVPLSLEEEKRSIAELAPFR